MRLALRYPGYVDAKGRIERIGQAYLRGSGIQTTWIGWCDIGVMPGPPCVGQMLVKPGWAGDNGGGREFRRQRRCPARQRQHQPFFVLELPDLDVEPESSRGRSSEGVVANCIIDHAVSLAQSPSVPCLTMSVITDPGAILYNREWNYQCTHANCR